MGTRPVARWQAASRNGSRQARDWTLRLKVSRVRLPSGTALHTRRTLRVPRGRRTGDHGTDRASGAGRGRITHRGDKRPVRSGGRPTHGAHIAALHAWAAWNAPLPAPTDPYEDGVAHSSPRGTADGDREDPADGDLEPNPPVPRSSTAPALRLFGLSSKRCQERAAQIAFLACPGAGQAFHMPRRVPEAILVPAAGRHLPRFPGTRKIPRPATAAARSPPEGGVTMRCRSACSGAPVILIPLSAKMGVRPAPPLNVPFSRWLCPGPWA
ncbi:hypothetical protein SAMN05428941_6461 [Streptomyces sp. 2114.2]|uniref:Uncharacterized protein n=1 Tax=Streptomyces lividans TK24 TaxID=457428 RepID=A0ABM5QWU0_STRLI|nr:hypothetical protein SLIV_06470 [Streptomyces lividans TK24]PSK54862.1 hypothetical protein B0E38_03401 [Streptomyces sp. 111WW2]QSJ07817.1 hypothetical protein SLIVDG2_06470 [Streptomyces lividans]REH24551.1 hypothetical protein BX268_6473 [Streptomyces sp. 2221.1]SDT78609.1 hypothetical protein SAMN05428941_6461 [Streptomyces sp. 2114.2]